MLLKDEICENMKDSKLVGKFVLLLAASCASLKVYRSTLPLGSKSGISGLKFVNQNDKINYTNSMTFCGRFNYKNLGSQSIMFSIDEEMKIRPYLWIKMEYPLAFMSFGNYDNDQVNFANWILQNPKTEEFSIWYPNKWHHFCIAHDNERSHIALVLVSFYHINICLSTFNHNCIITFRMVISVM